MAKYELMLIINPTITEQERNESVSGLKTLFAKNEVTISKEDVWGDKKLAYKINKLDRGFYVLFDLEMNGKLIKELSKTINLDKNILRYMFTRVDA
ncbi:MAG: 30S ribosomal protein S6 [Candidatus Gracilibacteria bacterium]|nr:30S ribosomal protein S6 [Candidatus Gracilibacteria bacterium]